MACLVCFLKQPWDHLSREDITHIGLESPLHQSLNKKYVPQANLVGYFLNCYCLFQNDPSLCQVDIKTSLRTIKVSITS